MENRWKDNCPACPYFDDCNGTKTGEECTTFLNNKLKTLIKSRNK